MKSKLLFCAMAALLTAGNAVAESTVTKKYLKLTDDEFVVNRWWNETNSNTVSDDGTQFYIYGQPGNVEGVTEYYGGQVGWNFSEPIATADWDKLVMKLKNAGPAALQARVSDNEGYEATHDFNVDADNVATYEFNLSSLTGSKNSENKTITNISSVYFWGYWGGGNTVTVDEIYFEKTVDTPVSSEDTKEISISDPTQGEYTLDGATDYKYLVVVPAKPFVDVENAPQYIYHISDGTTNIGDWGFAYGYFQQRRASVLNLKDKKVYGYSSNETADTIKNFSTSEIDMAKLTRFYVAKGWADANTVVNEHEISAIYFTNEMPTYNNHWNFPVSGQDYMREATTAGTYGTVCLPYNAAICGAYAYKVVGVDSKENPSKLYLEQVYGLLKAGVPYVFKTNTDSVSNFQEGYVTFYKAGATTVVAPADDNALVGNLNVDDANVPEDSYILTSDGTWGKGTGNTVGQYKAYLTLTDDLVVPTEDAAKYITMDINGGDVTAINSVKTAEKADGAVYNLNGVRVINPTKGLYIKNGKKYIVK